MRGILVEAIEVAVRRGDTPVLRGVSLTVRSGERWVLAGPNGSGKTTLLGLLARTHHPDDGIVRGSPGIAIASVGQVDGPHPAATLWDVAAAALASLRELERELEAARARLEAAPADAADALGSRYAELLALYDERGGFGAETALRRTLGRLGVDEAAAAQPAADLPTGLRRRAAIAGALASGAELILLDEPTNGLDLPSRIAMADEIVGHRSTFAIATHDRAFADRVATHVALLDAGRLGARRGTLSNALEERMAERRARDRAERERRRRAEELARMAAELARHGHRTAQVRRRRAERERRSILDRLGADDDGGDASEAGSTAVDATAAGGALAAAHGAPGRHRSSHRLLVARHLSVHGVLEDATVELFPGDRVALVGAGGSGRTTLLELLAGARASSDPRAEVSVMDGQRVVWSDRATRGIAPDHTPRAALSEWVGAARAASLLSLAGLPPETWDRSAHTLSGGERARAGLALLVACEADLLLIDEPTDDLDLSGVLQLEETLAAAPAALVIATHDERLVEALGAEAWSIEGGAVVRYRGGMAGYRRGARRLEPGVRGDAPYRVGPSVAEGDDATDGAAHPSHGTGDGGPDGGDDPLAPIEAALRTIEDALLDPERWGARELQRLRRRRRTLEERYLERLDAVMPRPRPRFTTREEGIAVSADREDDGLRVRLEPGVEAMHPAPDAGPDAGPHAGTGAGPEVRVRVVGEVGHLAPVARHDACTVPWAAKALYRAAARLALYLLPVEVVQVASPLDLHDVAFRSIGGGWWTLSRTELERQEGWRASGGGDRTDGATTRERGARRRRRRRVRAR